MSAKCCQDQLMMSLPRHPSVGGGGSYNFQSQLTHLVYLDYGYHGQRTDYFYFSLSLSLSLSRQSFPYIKNCGICLIIGRKSIKVTQSVFRGVFKVSCALEGVLKHFQGSCLLEKPKMFAHTLVKSLDAHGHYVYKQVTKFRFNSQFIN